MPSRIRYTLFIYSLTSIQGNILNLKLDTVLLIDQTYLYKFLLSWKKSLLSQVSKLIVTYWGLLFKIIICWNLLKKGLVNCLFVTSMLRAIPDKKLSRLGFLESRRLLLTFPAGDSYFISSIYLLLPISGQ